MYRSISRSEKRLVSTQSHPNEHHRCFIKNIQNQLDASTSSKFDQKGNLQQYHPPTRKQGLNILGMMVAVSNPFIYGLIFWWGEWHWSGISVDFQVSICSTSLSSNKPPLAATGLDVNFPATSFGLGIIAPSEKRGVFWGCHTFLDGPEIPNNWDV